MPDVLNYGVSYKKRTIEILIMKRFTETGTVKSRLKSGLVRRVLKRPRFHTSKVHTLDPRIKEIRLRQKITSLWRNYASNEC